MAAPAAIQIPGKAISPNGTDLETPVLTLLRGLNLLAKQGEDGSGADTILKGPPMSVALIESGATTATKWWAGGMGATVIAAWAKILTWYQHQPLGPQEVALGGGFLLTASAIWAIGYLFASDVRGRARAAVATIEARQAIAATMIVAAEGASTASPASTPVITEGAVQRLPLTPPIAVKNFTEPAENEDGWRAIAVEFHPEDTGPRYLLVKGSDEVVLNHSQLAFSS